jgi:hypothetical protein
MNLECPDPLAPTRKYTHGPIYEDTILHQTDKVTACSCLVVVTLVCVHFTKKEHAHCFITTHLQTPPRSPTWCAKFRTSEPSRVASDRRHLPNRQNCSRIRTADIDPGGVTCRPEARVALPRGSLQAGHRKSASCLEILLVC